MRFLGSVAVIALMVGAAHAQAPSQPSTGTPASPSRTDAKPPQQQPSMADPSGAMPQKGQRDAGAPLPGANSFTEAQARSRIENLGFTSVAGLTKDVNGVWRGKAMKDGKTEDVAIDYRGNIVVSQK